MILTALSLALAGTPQTYIVAPRPHGEVRFAIESPIDDIDGETKSIGGSITVDFEDLAKGTAVIGVALDTLRTGIDQRDDDMRIEFLQTARFPTALLVVDQLGSLSAPKLTPGSSVTATAQGSFEVHGVRRRVSVPVTLKLAGDRLTAAGAFEVVLSDYAVNRPQRLFFKLGEVVKVRFDVQFIARAPSAPAPTADKGSSTVVPDAPKPTVADVQPAAPAPKPLPKRKAKPAIAVTYLFGGDDDKAKGEKLFHDVNIGGPGNKMTCYTCHSKSDERESLVLKDGYIRAASTMYNAGQRPKFWGGFANSIGSASSICHKQFMRGGGLSQLQEAQLTSFVNAISPDASAELDYKTMYRTMESSVRDPLGGDAKKGKALADKYCMTCHLDGRVGPVWQPGLYEPDWLVRRVRRLEGHQNRLMPMFSLTRLPDSDVRDIVTFLAGPQNQKVFNRKNPK
jgi:polyisoprenoid-binding protein YceI/mono/diheme cytochrome c family protein